MIWTYRVVYDEIGRYSVRELFYERDGALITYSSIPVAPVGSSPEELLRQMDQLREAFDLPILSTAELDAAVSKQKVAGQKETGPRISLEQVKAELIAEIEPV